MVYFTAITLKLNSKPWIKTTSDTIYFGQLMDIATKYKCKIHTQYGFEMDKQCQLHIHATLKSKKPLFRKKVCSYYRKTYKNHSIWLRPVENLEKWVSYCNKSSFDERMCYKTIVKYYKNPTKYCIDKPFKLNHKLIFEKNNIIVNTTSGMFEKKKQQLYKCEFI